MTSGRIATPQHFQEFWQTPVKPSEGIGPFCDDLDGEPEYEDAAAPPPPSLAQKS